jgi:predicted metal-dependent phosphoesterase TrpH
MCEEKHIEYISLTDHDTCKQYQDEILKNNTIFSGKIIKGSELHAMFQNENIEILAYNIKPDIEIGIGRGNLNITKEIIEEWL